MLRKIEGRRGMGWQRMRWFDAITDTMDMSLSKLWNWWWTGKPDVLQCMGSQRIGHYWETELNYLLSEINEKSWLTGKDSDAGRDWGQEEKRMTEDDMAGWHHWWWTWVWVNSRSWWWTGRPGMLRFMGLQRVGHYWATELNLILFNINMLSFLSSNHKSNETESR